MTHAFSWASVAHMGVYTRSPLQPVRVLEVGLSDVNTHSITYKVLSLDNDLALR